MQQQKQKAKDPYAANFAALQAKQKAEKEAAAAPVIPAPAPVVEKAKVAEVVAEKKEEGGDVNKVEKKRLKAEKKAAKEAKKAAKEVVVGTFYSFPPLEPCQTAHFLNVSLYK